jgi:hypothetical protein
MSRSRLGTNLPKHPVCSQVRKHRCHTVHLITGRAMQFINKTSSHSFYGALFTEVRLLATSSRLLPISAVACARTLVTSRQAQLQIAICTWVA